MPLENKDIAWIDHRLRNTVYGITPMGLLTVNIRKDIPKEEIENDISRLLKHSDYYCKDMVFYKKDIAE